MKYKIVLTTGGTGGHVYPAIAVAEKLKDKAELLFIGSKYGAEAEMIQRENIPFYGLSVKGILGKKLQAFHGLYKMVQGVFEAKSVINDFKPDMVIGFGSYASFAPLFAAFLSRITVVIHEQNVVPGLANRVAARFAKRVLLSMPDKLQVFKHCRTVYTGNPVRNAIVSLRSKKIEPKKRLAKRLLVMGGSLGASKINDVITSNLGRLFDNKIEIYHQTGFKDWDSVGLKYGQYEGMSCKIVPFINDIAEAYRWADLVLCRSGASSVAELAVIGKPSILIPFPYATHDHQTYNAQFLSNEGAAYMVSEKDLDRIDIIEMIVELFSNPKKLSEMSHRAFVCGCPDAANAVVREVLDLLQ